MGKVLDSLLAGGGDDYDYEAARKAGVTAPDASGHWPSQFKRGNNDRLIMPVRGGGYVNTQTNEWMVQPPASHAEAAKRLLNRAISGDPNGWADTGYGTGSVPGPPPGVIPKQHPFRIAAALPVNDLWQYPLDIDQETLYGMLQAEQPDRHATWRGQGRIPVDALQPWVGDVFDTPLYTRAIRRRPPGLDELWASYNDRYHAFRDASNRRDRPVVVYQNPAPVQSVPLGMMDPIPGEWFSRELPVYMGRFNQG